MQHVKTYNFFILRYFTLLSLIPFQIKKIDH
jgi:hypothetical protein